MASQADIRTALAARLLTSLEAMLSPSAYVSLTPADRADFVNVLAQQRWVETLDTTLQILVAASVRSLHYSLC